MNILKAVNLRKIYGQGETEVKALDGVNLEVEKGEFVAIVGTSGSGKSTMLHMIGGLDNPTSGQVIVDGQNLSHMTDEKLTIFRRRNIGFVFQQYNLVPMLNVWENIVLPVKLDGKKVEKGYVDEIIDTLGIRTKLENLPSALSGGQQQRVAIARALGMEPEFLVADEPIASLDVSIQAQIVNLFRHLQEEHGFTFLFIAHDLAMVEYLCDRVGVMYHGKLVELAPSEELYSNPVHPYTKTLLSAIPVPDPIRERKRVLQYYDGEGMENSVWTEVSPGHFAMLPAEGKGGSI